MKYAKPTLVALSLGALLAVNQPTRADDATTTTPPANTTTAAPDNSTAPSTTTAPAPGLRPHGAHRGGFNLFQALSDALTLTDDQKLKVRPIVGQYNQQVHVIHRDQTLTLDQKRQKSKDLLDTTFQQINALLTPDQQTKFLSWQQAHEGKHGNLKPEAPTANGTGTANGATSTNGAAPATTNPAP